MVDDHLAAILYGEAVLRPAMGAGAVVAHADMADDDVVRVLDEDRRAPFRAARMGDDDAAARRRLPRYGEIGIGDHRRARGEADRAAHPEYADAGSGGVDAGAKRPRPAVGQRVDADRKSTRLNSSH